MFVIQMCYEIIKMKRKIKAGEFILEGLNSQVLGIIHIPLVYNK